MAEQAKKEAEIVYWRSKVSGLTIFKKGNENATMRFQPFLEKYQGDDIRVGYLACDDADFNAILKADDLVEEITKAEYDKATGDNSTPASYATA
jgi:3-deoxy-D-manno-octulosonate 8-phosphate phosphatase KdsC-like HAD superfamily phosphatase